MNYLIITIDVEGPKGEGFDSSNPVENFIWCRDSSGNSYGIEMIMDMLDSFDIKGLFFVDLAEVFDYGKPPIANVIEKIEERGHQLGVHLHPNHMFDEKRHFLYQYTYEEQYLMISKCTRMFEDIVGRKPLYFRAGKYSANYDTLNILCELGYKYDFSEYFKSKWCGLTPPITADMPCRYRTIIEIPVTTFYSIKLPFYKRVDKIDLEMASVGHDYVIKRIARLDKSIAILFLHSFSFVDWRENPETPKFNKKKYKKVLKNLKRTLNTNDIVVIDPSQIDNYIDNNNIDLLNNEKCRIAIDNPFLSYVFIMATANRIKKTNMRARLLWIGNSLAISAIVVLIFVYALWLSR